MVDAGNGATDAGNGNDEPGTGINDAGSVTSDAGEIVDAAAPSDAGDVVEDAGNTVWDAGDMTVAGDGGMNAGYIEVDAGPPNPNLYLDGVTVKCPDAALDESGAPNNIRYIKRDRAGLDALVAAEDLTP